MTAFADDVMVRHLCEQTDRLLSTLHSMDDDDVRSPSILPGWSRAHVLTHVARNADGLANVASSAITGELTAMYPSSAARDADIEVGAGRSASHLEADVESSAERLLALLAAVPEHALDVEVPNGRGGAVRVGDLPWLRVREVAYHHVDLDCGYTFADVPLDLLRRGLAECEHRLREAAPGLGLTAELADGTQVDLLIGDGRGAATGPAHSVLAWLTGRSSGDGVHTVDGKPLPSLPSWG